MPSDTSAACSARCYCGASEFSIQGPPETVAYCHCTDCRRWTGAPVAAFAAFAVRTVIENLHDHPSTNGGVKRWNCGKCGSPLAASFDYLSAQIYVPLGIIDQADRLVPVRHSHHASRLSWLHIADDLPKSDGTARSDLSKQNT